MEKKLPKTLWWTTLNATELQKVTGLREVGLVFTGVLLIWGLYRMFFPLSVWVEEIGLKALVFGVPVWWQARKHGWGLLQLGISVKNLFTSTYLGLLLGMLLGLTGQLANMIRHGGLSLSTYGITSETMGGFLLLALITAFWEQLLFSGYILRAIYESGQSERQSVAVTSGLFVVLHLPMLVLVQGMSISQIVLSSGLLFLLQSGCGVLRLRTGNLAAPILAQALWGVTVYLFR